MAKIIEFTGVTTLDLQPERVLLKSIDKDLEGCVVMGFAKDGSEYFASSYADGGTVLWLVERMKKRLLEVPEHED